MSKIDSYGDSFFTDSYGAFRWDKNLCLNDGRWYLVTFNTEFDRMRGIGNDDIHITCVVDNFGDLVRVKV